jgi:integrase
MAAAVERDVDRVSKWSHFSLLSLDALPAFTGPYSGHCRPLDVEPRELRHSFVSVLSDAGVPLEEISQLVGHSGTTVTELVYRHQLKPVIQTGATVMDRLFGA